MGKSKSENQRLVEDIMLKNSNALAQIEKRFKLDIPSILDFRFTSDTEAHILALTKELIGLQFMNPTIQFGRKEWLLTIQTNTPIQLIVTQKFVEKLASLLAKHKCTLDRWQKRYMI
jgi:hypothetical protein